MLDNSLAVHRYGFPSRLAFKLDAYNLFRIVMVVEERVDTSRIRGRSVPEDTPGGDHFNAFRPALIASKVSAGKGSIFLVASYMRQVLHSYFIQCTTAAYRWWE